MRTSLSIGDFARATHLSVKALRHYHEAGVLEPADIDSQSGYRRYLPEQIPTAQVIRRFRSLDMPLPDIRAVLSAPDLRTRNNLIAAHLNRLEESLAKTQSAVASLRGLLEQTPPSASIEQRSVQSTQAAAISEVIAAKDALEWWQGALGELHATLAAQGIPATAVAGGIYSDEIFSQERGQATLFIPSGGIIRSVGRVTPQVVPAAELAIVVHNGSHRDVDQSYGILAAYVTEHALAVDGPIREYYLVSPQDTSVESAWKN